MQKRDFNIDFYLGSFVNSRLLEHLNLRRWPNLSDYDWINAKVAGISSALSTEATLSKYDIVVDDSLEWLVLLVSLRLTQKISGLVLCEKCECDVRVRRNQDFRIVGST